MPLLHEFKVLFGLIVFVIFYWNDLLGVFGVNHVHEGPIRDPVKQPTALDLLFAGWIVLQSGEGFLKFLIPKLLKGLSIKHATIVLSDILSIYWGKPLCLDLLIDFADIPDIIGLLYLLVHNLFKGLADEVLLDRTVVILER
jgi:hypothetical protein